MHWIFEKIEDQGYALKSPTSLAALYRVSAGCLKDQFIDLDLFLGTGSREIGRYFGFPFLYWIDSPSTAPVLTDFTIFCFGLIALLDRLGELYFRDRFASRFVSYRSLRIASYRSLRFVLLRFALGFPVLLGFKIKVIM